MRSVSFRALPLLFAGRETRYQTRSAHGKFACVSASSPRLGTVSAGCKQQTRETVRRFHADFANRRSQAQAFSGWKRLIRESIITRFAPLVNDSSPPSVSLRKESRNLRCFPAIRSETGRRALIILAVLRYTDAVYQPDSSGKCAANFSDAAPTSHWPPKSGLRVGKSACRFAGTFASGRADWKQSA